MTLWFTPILIKLCSITQWQHSNIKGLQTLQDHTMGSQPCFHLHGSHASHHWSLSQPDMLQCVNPLKQEHAAWGHGVEQNDLCPGSRQFIIHSSENELESWLIFYLWMFYLHILPTQPHLAMFYPHSN